MVSLDVIGVVDPVERFTKETGDEVELKNNFRFETIWSVTSLSKIHGFVKTKFTKVLKLMRKPTAVV